MPDPTYGGRTAADLAALLERATPGEWYVWPNTNTTSSRMLAIEDRTFAWVNFAGNDDGAAGWQAALIVAAVNALSDLLARLAALEALADAVAADAERRAAQAGPDVVGLDVLGADVAAALVEVRHD